jgi:hypothetical protein
VEKIPLQVFAQSRIESPIPIEVAKYVTRQVTEVVKDPAQWDFPRSIQGFMVIEYLVAGYLRDCFNTLPLSVDERRDIRTGIAEWGTPRNAGPRGVSPAPMQAAKRHSIVSGARRFCQEAIRRQHFPFWTADAVEQLHKHVHHTFLRSFGLPRILRFQS